MPSTTALPLNSESVDALNVEHSGTWLRIVPSVRRDQTRQQVGSMEREQKEWPGLMPVRKEASSHKLQAATIAQHNLSRGARGRA